MHKKLITILFLGLSSLLFGQHKITGYAPDFLGETVKVYTYQEYVTLTKILIGEGTVSPIDSTFEVDLNTNSTIKVIVEIGRNEARLYVAPEMDYTIFFPRSEAPLSYNNAETNIYFSDLDTTDINYRIFRYHEWFDAYIAYHEKDVAKGGFITYLDSFKLYVADVYKDIKDPFFITYVRYDIAQMEQTLNMNQNGEKRLQTYLQYIESFPVYYENDRYMEFIMDFYDKEFREYTPVTEDAIYAAIRNSSPTELLRALKNDIFLARPELRELIMLDKLGKAFYREMSLRPNIITILDSIGTKASTSFNSSVALNVKNYVTNLEPGYPAPAIQFIDENSKLVNWSTFKGKYVYFNFFATWNERSITDMEVIYKLVQKYGEDIEFISVCTDKDENTFKAFMKEYPAYDWNIFYVGEDTDLMRSFNVTSVPNYYLIDQEGFISAAPALAPTPNGEKKYIEEVLFKIQKALHDTGLPGVGRQN